MGKTKVICFANNKGGSGKSTTCANVGCGLAGLGKKVLLIDGDMQLNLSLSYFPEEKVLEFARGEKNLYYAVKDQKDLNRNFLSLGITLLFHIHKGIIGCRQALDFLAFRYFLWYNTY